MPIFVGVVVVVVVVDDDDGEEVEEEEEEEEEEVGVPNGAVGLGWLLPSGAERQTLEPRLRLLQLGLFRPGL